MYMYNLYMHKVGAVALYLAEIVFTVDTSGARSGFRLGVKTPRPFPLSFHRYPPPPPFKPSPAKARGRGDFAPPFSRGRGQPCYPFCPPSTSNGTPG
jgi:hypothetical protein